MNFDSIDAFLRHLATLPGAVREAEHRGLDDAGKGLVVGAQAMIGEEIGEWADLAPSTVEEKTRLGYTGRVSATDPLYRTGELRVSIIYTVDANILTLGSTDPVAYWQEFGTSRIPPRSFIGATMYRDGHAAADLVFEHMMAAFSSWQAPQRPQHESLTGG